MNSDNAQKSSYIGPLYVVYAGLAFATMGALIKLLSADISSEVIVFFRSLMGLLFLIPILISEKVSIKTEIPWMHFLRGLVGFGAMYSFFYSISLIPLSQAVLLTYTTPLFAPLIALVWLGERMGRLVIAAVIIGFIGVMLIIKPDSCGMVQFGGWIALSSGLMAAVALTSIRRMSNTEPMLRIVFYHTLFSTLASSILVIPQWLMPKIEHLLILFAIGVLATLGQMFITRGYSNAPVATAGPFTFSTVIFAAIFGAAFWQEVFDLWNLLGTVLVVLGGVLALRVKS